MKNRSREKDRSFDRALVWGLVISVLGHAVLFLVFSARPLPVAPFAAAGERRGDLRAAAGGGMEAVQLRTPTELLQPPPPIPAPTPDVTELEPPEPELTEEEIPAIALADAVAVPGTEGPAEGPGVADATGEGDGGTEAEGRFRVVPPRPKGMIMPPADRPDEIRGKEVEVWVWVAATGRVVPDSTRLRSPVNDRGFNRRLRDFASEWVFDPALRDGRPVGEWFRYTIIM